MNDARTTEESSQKTQKWLVTILLSVLVAAMSAFLVNQFGKGPLDTLAEGMQMESSFGGSKISLAEWRSIVVELVDTAVALVVFTIALVVFRPRARN